MNDFYIFKKHFKIFSTGVVVDNNNIVMNAAPTEMNRNIGVESAVACHLPAEVMKIT